MGSVGPEPGRFTIDGRVAPALYVFGWLATIAGLGAIVVVLASLPPGGAVAASPILAILALVGVLALGVGIVAGAGSQAIERHARPIPGTYRGPSPILLFGAALVWTLIATTLAAVVAGAIGPPMTSSGSLATPAFVLVSLVLTAFVYVGLVRLVVVGTGVLSWAEMGIRRFDRVAMRALVVGAGWALPVVIVTTAIAVVLSQFMPVAPQVLPQPSGAGDLVLLFLAAVIAAPIGEEIFFRAFSTTAWLGSMPAGRAIIRGAIFFAAVHVITVNADSFGVGLLQALYAFLVRLPVAVTLGWLFVRYRSIYASIGLHAAFNAVGVLGLALASS